MTFRNILLIAILFLLPGLSIAQTYDIILKGGHVIDPKNKIDAVMDLAIKDKKIAWFWHPIASLLTVVVYGSVFFTSTRLAKKYIK